MRRVIGLVGGAALALALSSAALAANSGALFATGHPDLGSQLMFRLFGETSDSSASFAAAHGDRTSESPLRDLALQINSAGRNPTFEAGESSTPGRFAVRDGSGETIASLNQGIGQGLAPSVVRFAPSSQVDSLVTLQPSTPLNSAAYQPVSPVPDISPGPGTLAFSPLVTGSVGLGDELPAAKQSAVYVPSTVQLGRVQFEGHVEGASTETPQLSLNDNSYGAGANVDVRAGRRNLNLNISSSYEHLGRSDSSFSASALDPTAWRLPGPGGPLVVPSYADLNKLSVGAGLAVPVLRGLTLNLNYDAQRLYGGYGLPGLYNLDTVTNSYGGKLTFQIPDTSSTLSIGAYQDRYQDNVLPLNGSTQMREDVNFTVKF